MKGSMDRVHRDGPWTWGPCFVYILLETFHRQKRGQNVFCFYSNLPGEGSVRSYPFPVSAVIHQKGSYSASKQRFVTVDFAL